MPAKGRVAVAPRNTPGDDPDRHPSSPIPRDRAHEFLSEWIYVHSPILKGWEEDFERKGIPYLRDTNERNYCMLYKHRFKTAGEHINAARKSDDMTRSRWCCP